MVLDIVGSILQAAITFGDISYEQMFDDTLSIPIISHNRSKLSGLYIQILAAKVVAYILRIKLVLTYQNHEGT